MTKFRKWLIRKLGGCVYLEQSIVEKTAPIITLHVDIEQPPDEFLIPETEVVEMVDRNACLGIAEQIYKLGAYVKTETFNSMTNRKINRYTIRVAKGVEE